MFSALAAWGARWAPDDLLYAKTLDEASNHLAALLRNKRMLLIIDDVWQTEHGVPFRVGGRGCGTFITTRSQEVAQALAPTPNDIYRLPVLDDDSALKLLQQLAPSVVEQNYEESLLLGART